MAVSKNNVDYFPFLCKEGKTLRFIDAKYGNDGFSTWIRLLRELAITDFHYLDLKDQNEFSDLAVKFKVSEQMFSDILNDLCNRNEVDRNLWEKERVVFSQKFVDHITDAYKKRVNKPVSIDGIIKIILSKRSNNTPLSIHDAPVKYDSSSGMTQSKEEQSKEQNSKANDACDSGDGFKYDFKETVPREAAELSEKLLDYFAASKDVMSPIYSKVENFIAMVSHRGEFEKLKTSFEKYQAYKARSQEQIHGIEKWMGTIDEHFKDGHWCMTDWDKKLNNLQKNEQQSIKGTSRTTSAKVSGITYGANGGF